MIRVTGSRKGRPGRAYLFGKSKGARIACAVVFAEFGVVKHE